jgi:serine/threonine protein kinase
VTIRLSLLGRAVRLESACFPAAQMDKYEFIKKLGSGNFGVINLMRHKETGEMVAVKQLPRGPKIDKNVYREVINHRKLSHPNVIGFKSIHVDSRYLYIVMEYGAGTLHKHVKSVSNTSMQPAEC